MSMCALVDGSSVEIKMFLILLWSKAKEKSSPSISVHWTNMVVGVGRYLLVSAGMYVFQTEVDSFYLEFSC